MSTQNTPPTVDLELTVAESQALAYQRELQTAHHAVADRLAQEILGLVGAQCVLEFLPEQGDESGDEDEQDFAPARLILCEHLDPHYITAIVTQVQALKEQGEIPSNLSIAITQKALQDLDLGPDQPSWVVTNDQNATYWRNNPFQTTFCVLMLLGTFYYGLFIWNMFAIVKEANLKNFDWQAFYGHLGIGLNVFLLVFGYVMSYLRMRRVSLIVSWKDRTSLALLAVAVAGLILCCWIPCDTAARLTAQ